MKTEPLKIYFTDFLPQESLNTRLEKKLNQLQNKYKLIARKNLYCELKRQ